MNDEFDFLVIGGGSAGYAAASMAAKLGLKTGVIEGGEEIGGLCILRGCMPSKTLIESATRLDTIRRAKEFGLAAENYAPRGEEILARKRRLVAEFAEYRRQQLASGQFEFIRGRATFTDPNSVEVTWNGSSPRRITAKTFVISTGSVVDFVDIPGLSEMKPLTSDDALESAHIPRSIIVLGGGPTAMEFAYYYSGIGAEVIVIQRSSQILSGSDADVAEALREAMANRGIQIFSGTKLLRFESTPQHKRVHLEYRGWPRTVEAEEILYSLGRKAAIEGLNVVAAGVEVKERRIATNLRQQTNIPWIFAAGDVSGPNEIVHIAIEQGELAAQNAAAHLRGGVMRELDYRLKLSVVFTNPEVAELGRSERELTEAGVPFRVAKHSFSEHGKALVMGETAGFVKLIAAPDTGEILGAAAVGPHASDLIHEIVVALFYRATAADLAKVPHYHPTLSEIWSYPAEELA